MIIPLAFQYALWTGSRVWESLPVCHYFVSVQKISVVHEHWTLTLPRFFGVESVFYAEPVSDLVGGIVSTVVFFCLINKILKKRDLAVRAQQQNSIVK